MRMRALTIKQPYPHLIAIGEKVIENRTWATAYRGTLLIHAGKSRSMLTPEDELDYPDMVFSAIVAIATLSDCLHLSKLPDHLKQHAHAHGPICWVLTNVRRLPVPVPCSGSQGLWIPEMPIREAVLRVAA